MEVVGSGGCMIPVTRSTLTVKPRPGFEEKKKQAGGYKGLWRSRLSHTLHDHMYFVLLHLGTTVGLCCGAGAHVKFGSPSPPDDHSGCSSERRLRNRPVGIRHGNRGLCAVHAV